jgi:hypothetical protein
MKLTVSDKCNVDCYIRCSLFTGCLLRESFSKGKCFQAKCFQAGDFSDSLLNNFTVSTELITVPLFREIRYDEFVVTGRCFRRSLHVT